MSQIPTGPKPTLDKDLDKITRMEQSSQFLSRRLVGPGFAILFLALSLIFAGFFIGTGSGSFTIMAAAVIGAYMAINIGANDVANNVGPAVGSNALTMGGALVIAAIFETAGALIAGGDVVGTISKNIVSPDSFSDSDIFIWAMMAALISSALWVNLATWIGAPVSTTHAVVGGVVGAGIAAAGFEAVNWVKMASIAASWVISPALGGIIAALFLAFIKTFIIYREDKIAAARRWVPVLVAIMAGAFTSYLAVKGLKKIIKIDLQLALMIGVVAFGITWVIVKPLIKWQSEGMENRNQSLRKLFSIPLVFSAALLSFAHGANDVANAVGPLAAIVHTVQIGDIAAKVTIPLWVMFIGAAGISFGLVFFGPKLIRMVGQKITRLNPMRAYCVALSAAITVIIASWFGLPVSSTHIAVGAIFGVGFFREWYTGNSKRRKRYIKKHTINDSSDDDMSLNVAEIKRRKLVRRSHFMTIIAAWVITVPAAALLSAIVFKILSAIFI